MSSTRESRVLMSACRPDPSSKSRRGMGLFMALERDWAILLMSYENEQTCYLKKTFRLTEGWKNYPDKSTLMTVSGVMSSCSICGEGGCDGDTRPVFPCLEASVLGWPGFFSRGRVFLKILTISRLMGNMMIELWTPIITCCQVNSIWPSEWQIKGQIDRMR